MDPNHLVRIASAPTRPKARRLDVLSSDYFLVGAAGASGATGTAGAANGAIVVGDRFIARTALNIASSAADAAKAAAESATESNVTRNK